MNNSSQLLDYNTTDQHGNPDAGVHATAETSATLEVSRILQKWTDRQPGKEWRDAAKPLTQWTNDRLVNRTDVYRGYKLPHNRYLGEPITYTKPYLEEARDFGSLTMGIVEGHYRGGDLVGLHAISFDNTAM